MIETFSVSSLFLASQWLPDPRSPWDHGKESNAGAVIVFLSTGDSAPHASYCGLKGIIVHGLMFSLHGVDAIKVSRSLARLSTSS